MGRVIFNGRGIIHAKNYYGRLLEQDILSVENWENKHKSDYIQPEKRLMLAVLEDAIDQFKKAVFALSENLQNYHQKSILYDIKEYMEVNDRHWLFSYENICSELELNSDWLRKGLYEWEKGVWKRRELWLRVQKQAQIQERELKYREQQRTYYLSTQESSELSQKTYDLSRAEPFRKGPFEESYDPASLTGRISGNVVRETSE